MSDDASKVEGKEEALKVSFSGTGPQYFKIFVSNTLLTIVTLGIYSAWARVRTRRFFMGHTSIGKHNLEFDASPLAILFSRIIVVVVLGLLLFIEINFNLIWADVGVFLLGTLALTPFAVVRGRAFIARHTLHRTVRFHYRREYLWAARLFIAYSALIILFYIATFTEDDFTSPYESLILPVLIAYIIAAPGLLYFSHRIQIGQLQFGKLRLSFESSVGRYYLECLMAFGAALVLCLLFYLYVTIRENLTGSTPDILFFVFMGGLGVLHILALFRSAFTCVYWQSIRIGSDSTIDAEKLDVVKYAGLLTQNYVMILLSLGLLYPFARVRAYNHIAERIEIKLGPKTAAAYHASTDKTSPLAGEFTDLTDWDMDFGAF